MDAVVGLFVVVPAEAAPHDAATTTEAGAQVAVELLVGAMTGGSRRGEGCAGAMLKAGRGVGTGKFVCC